jgi:transposase-like protein
MNTKPAKSTYSIPPKSLRFPEACGDLQVNACRNATCEGFGVEALTWVKRGRPTAGHTGKRDNYRLINKSRKMPDGLLMCKLCGSSTAIKSNKAIRAEFERISSYLQAPDEPSCPSGACCNRGVGVYSNPNAYTCKAKLKTSQRIKCKECGCVFSVVTSSLHRQRKPHENKTVFQEIVTKKPIRGIAKVADLRPKAVYGKIDFIYQQCLGFLGEREAEAHKHRRQYVRLCVDKQDYMINWRSRKTRKNTQFTSIATVEGKSGYVLGHHLNFEPDVEQVAVDDLAKAHGDLMAGSRPAFHAQPQYWKSDEFAEHALSPGFEVRPDPDEEPLLVQDLIQLKDAVMANWPYPEMSDCPGSSNKLPEAGVMTHSSYTAYAHALLVRQLIGTARKIDIYSDQDDVLRNAYISAFKGSVLSDRANMAYVQFQKHMTIDEKRQLSNRARARLAASASRLNLDKEVMIARMMGLEYAARCEREAAWRRRWVPHPKDTLNEPRRRVQFVTDTGRKSLEEIGWMLSGASLAPVDNYFMRIRRLIYYLERPIPSHTNAGRLYYGYAAYDPKRVLQLLTIFRTFTNYIDTDDNGETPAMRFGLARGRVRFEDVLYWRPKGWERMQSE